MAKRRARNKSVGWLVVATLVVFAAAAAGAYYYVTRGSGPGPALSDRGGSRPSASVSVQDVPREVTVYLPKASKFDELERVVKKTDDEGPILDVALEMLVTEGAKAGSIPDGTRVLAPVKVSGRVAIIDLSQEFVDNFPGGSTQEAVTLNSICRTLVDNSGGDVREVKILVEGESVESLGGHFDLREPLDVKTTELTSEVVY